MKEFTLPVSDCGCFLAGDISEASQQIPGEKAWPKNGVIVFYETEDAMKAAFKAASDAHWPHSDIAER